jgi:hypothetical protein
MIGIERDFARTIEYSTRQSKGLKVLDRIVHRTLREPRALAANTLFSGGTITRLAPTARRE